MTVVNATSGGLNVEMNVFTVTFHELVMSDYVTNTKISEIQLLCNGALVEDTAPFSLHSAISSADITSHRERDVNLGRSREWEALVRGVDPHDHGHVLPTIR